jgi:hypothetical protein
MSRFINGFLAVAEKMKALPARKPPQPSSWEGTGIQDDLLTPDELRARDKHFMAQIKAKNDRGVALTSFAIVEERLAWMIEKKFVRGLPTADKRWLVRAGGPLSTFAARTEVAFAFGIIPRALRDNLRLLGRIRNRFAHSAAPIAFTDPDIAPLCARLSAHSFGDFASRGPREVYALECFACMIVLLVFGQFPNQDSVGGPADRAYEEADAANSAEGSHSGT